MKDTETLKAHIAYAMREIEKHEKAKADMESFLEKKEMELAELTNKDSQKSVQGYTVMCPVSVEFDSFGAITKIEIDFNNKQ